MPLSYKGPPSDIRFILAQMVQYGATGELLEERCMEQLMDENDTIDSVHRKINAVLDRDIHEICDFQAFDPMPTTSGPDSPLSFFTQSNKMWH
jgi:hypothetical protein